MNTPLLRCRSVAALLTAWLAILSAPAAAQCDNAWLPGEGVAGCDGMVHATLLWDRDGAGPIAPVLIVGGNFTVVGSIVARNLAAYDPATGTWSELGDGMQRMVTSLATLPNGDLLIGGHFSYLPGGVASRCLARWDGAAMHSMGFTGFVSMDCMCVMPNGDIVAAGKLENSNGSASVRRWNGFGWFTIGAMWASGTGTVPSVRALQALPNGDLIAGGWFTSVQWVPANCVARWDGTVWSALGTGVAGSTHAPRPIVNALTVLPNGDLIAGGNFLTAGGVGAHGVARWAGSSWSNIGSNWTATVAALLPMPNGDLVAGGYTHDSPTNVARWNGVTWTTLGSGVHDRPLIASSSPNVGTLVSLPNGDVVVGGAFREAGDAPASNIARWDGASWSGMATGSNGAVRAVAKMPDGDLVVGGDFTSIGGVAAGAVARWDGDSYTSLGSGMSNALLSTSLPRVLAVAVMPDGSVIAGGEFTFADGATVNHIARWDGASWLPLGTGMNAPVKALLALPNGDVVAGGEFTDAGGTQVSCIATWNGSSWSGVGAGLNRSASLTAPVGVYALAARANGDILAGGNFTRAGTDVANFAARWDGAAWHPMCVSMAGPTVIYSNPGVYSFCPLANGDVLVGGWFEQVNGYDFDHISRWSNNTWYSVGAGILSIPIGVTSAVYSIALLPDGDVLAGGAFDGAGSTAKHIARFDGVNWSPVDVGLSGPVHGLETAPNGDFVAVGSFTRPGSLYSYPTTSAVSAGLARLTTSCPVAMSSYGAGCSGAGGPNVLTATSLPWIGSNYTATATGMPLFGIAIEVRGFTQASVPLASILPEGVPGCDLLVVPGSLHLALPIAGVVESTIALPNEPSIVGLVFQQQMVAIELAPSGAITGLTSSNALELMIGAF